MTVLIYFLISSILINLAQTIDVEKNKMDKTYLLTLLAGLVFIPVIVVVLLVLGILHFLMSIDFKQVFKDVLGRD